MIRKLLGAGLLTLFTANYANAAVIFDGGPTTGDQAYGAWVNVSYGQNFAVKVDFADAVTINGFDLYNSYYVSVLNNPVILKVFAQDPSTISGLVPEKYYSTISDVQEFDFHAVNIAHADFSPIHLGAGEYWIGLSSANTTDISWSSYRKPDAIPHRPLQDQLQLSGDDFAYYPGIYNLAFKIDGTVGAISGVPEPSTWAMLILGFGATGISLRTGRKARVTSRA